MKSKLYGLAASLFFIASAHADTWTNPSEFQSTLSCLGTLTTATHTGTSNNSIIMHYGGNSHGAIFDRTAGTPVNGQVVLVTAQDLGDDSNPMDTTLGVTGYELGKGTVKISHNRPAGGAVNNDQNASVLSLRANGVGTAAQGIFFDAPDGTTGNLQNFRVGNVQKWLVTKDGYGMTGAVVPVNSTDGLKIGTSSSQKVGLWGATPITRPAVTGSRGGNAALASLLTALSNAGIITDTTTP